MENHFSLSTRQVFLLSNILTVRLTGFPKGEDRDELDGAQKILSSALKEQKKLRLSQLELLGERKWMEGVGILSIAENYYNVFYNDYLGTKFLGTYTQLSSAKKDLAEMIKRDIDDIDVYEWQMVADEWKVVQVYDLAEDEEIRKWVTGTLPIAPGDIAPENRCMACGVCARMSGHALCEGCKKVADDGTGGPHAGLIDHPDGFPGTDFD